VKIIGLDIIPNTPDASGHVPSPTERLTQTVENAILFEELGFDGFAVGERHHPPFLSSAPPVVLSHLAALTSRIRLFTGVTLLSVLDPVRVAEDYATVDHLSGGRLELIIGKGNGPEQAELFGIGRLDAWDTIRENYLPLRKVWSEQKVTWDAPTGVPSIRTAPLRDAEIWPKPLQQKVRIWHGSASAERSVELAAEHGDPIFSANGFNPLEHYGRLIDHYRAKWAEFGRDPQDALVGAGHIALVVRRTSQEAREAFRPSYEKLATSLRESGGHQLPGTFTIYEDYDDYLAQSSALVGSPQEVLDKVHRYHEAFGNTVIHISGHGGELGQGALRESLELFADQVAPELRASIPDPEWPEPVAPLRRTPARESVALA
jgi:alkanesulfonate monooxygenase SsuD/methylene tetrahydromethanopterin reductase-like flavin-dependent oxidoreductase (luciferase family)